MTPDIADTLSTLAARYECPEFMGEDPARFMHRYKDSRDAEVAAFIAAMLSFGRREQFCPKIERALAIGEGCGLDGSDGTDSTDGTLFEGIKQGKWKGVFRPPIRLEQSFYRMYTWGDLYALFERLEGILASSSTLGDYCHNIWNRAGSGDIIPMLASAFSGCRLVPQTATSAKKRLCLFLRWMVRSGPVDTGLWQWYPVKDLIIPLDTHVLAEAIALGLLPPKSTPSYSTAVKLTRVLAEIWPYDPLKGDFALFGLGVDKDRVALPLN